MINNSVNYANPVSPDECEICGWSFCDLKTCKTQKDAAKFVAEGYAIMNGKGRITDPPASSFPSSAPPPGTSSPPSPFPAAAPGQPHTFDADNYRRIWDASFEADGLKASNPKDGIGADKLPLHLWPETATAMGCMGLLDGALKYGRGNFRAIGVRASIYVDACKRHLNAWFEGEDDDRRENGGSGLPHLAHALACLAIIVDAEAHGELTDDRQYAGIPGYRLLVEHLTPHVALLKDKHADKSPKHYTIVDSDGDNYPESETVPETVPDPESETVQ